MKSIAIATLLLGLAAAAPALEFDQLLYNRAFSPNGDGVLDECYISFLANAGEDTLRLLQAVIATDPTVPPPPESILEIPIESTEPGGTLVSLHGSWDGRDDTETPYPDGFYYLHLFAVTDVDEHWLPVAVELEVNTVPPDFVSTSVEPSPWFTPLMAGADTLQQVFFTSESFDTLTDRAQMTLFRWWEVDGTYEEILTIERDPDYVLDTGAGLRYRFLWNGVDNMQMIQDGIYRGWILLEDDAGNRAETPVSLDMDVEPPLVTVLGMGGWPADETSFAFHPDALPDTIYLRTEDRHGVDSCRVAWGSEEEFDTWGVSMESGAEDYEDWYFLIPESWQADSTYSIRVDACDRAGQWRSELIAPTVFSVQLDSVDPEAPVWVTDGGQRIQSYLELIAVAGEGELTAFLFRDGSPVDTTDVGASTTIGFDVFLEEGSQVFTLQTVDGAGNESPLSEALELVYRPGAALHMPGRFRGGENETIQINTPGEARSVEIRVFSLEGRLFRSLDALGGPSEWIVDWDLLDEEGGRLMGGLYLVAVRSTMADGEILQDRKVVAIVQP